ncbi:hypothetical protein CFOL_v3_01435, partial [Cephalotus follicularis]
WDSLAEWNLQFQLPWLIASDFNDYANLYEHKSIWPTSLARCTKFQYNINRCNLLDLGFSGSPFTGTNCRKGLDKVSARLDRFMSSTSWKETFPNAIVVHLTRTHSDQHLILLDTMVNMPLITKPFQFIATWLSHQDFINVVKNCWEGDGFNLDDGIK